MTFCYKFLHLLNDVLYSSNMFLIYEFYISFYGKSYLGGLQVDNLRGGGPQNCWDLLRGLWCWKC
jgi:hypothetical protein